MANSENSALSGGMLVVLGIIVALGIGFFFWQYKGAEPAGSTNISVTTPEPSTAEPAAGSSSDSSTTTTTTTAPATSGAGSQ